MTLVVAGVLRRGDRVLACRRSRPAELAGHWEFPGGKVEAGETPERALVREWREELGIGVRLVAELVAAQGCWPINERLEMRVWWVVDEDADRDAAGPQPGDSHDRVCWANAPELAELAWLPADVAVAVEVARRLR